MSFMILKISLLIFGFFLFFLSFPTTMGHVAGFAWISLVPLLVLNGRLEKLQACFFWNWAFFQIVFLGLFYINPFQNPERLFSVGPVVGLASFYFLFPLLYATVFTIGTFFYKRGNAAIGVLGMASTWVVFEYALTCIPGLFPLSFAISQFSIPEFIQLCHFTGISGLSFVLVMINGVFFLGVKKRSLLITACVFVCFFWLLGHHRMVRIMPYTQGPIFLLIQPNIGYRDAWLSQLGNVHFSKILGRLMETTQKAIGDKHHNIVVWPELSLTNFALTDTRVVGKLKTILKDQNGIILGMPQQEQNAVFSFDENLNQQSVAVKTLPVPGFESYQRNHQPPMPLMVGKHKIGTSICYEILFGRISRMFVHNGAEILGAISFNTWLGNTNWAKLHAAYLPFRAVENNRPAFYLNNNGPSMSVTAQGQIISSLSLGTQGYLRFSPKLNTQASFYSRHGEWFFWVCLILFFGCCGFCLYKRRVVYTRH